MQRPVRGPEQQSPRGNKQERNSDPSNQETTPDNHFDTTRIWGKDMKQNHGESIIAQVSQLTEATTNDAAMGLPFPRLCSVSIIVCLRVW